ncbi:DMT family transporter [Corynebacterium sp. S7]
MQSSFVAVLFALASALTTAWATVIRHKVVNQVAAQSSNGTGNRSALLTGLTHPVWWLTIAAAFVAYLLQVVALGFGTLLVVQPILVLSLLFTLLLSARMNRKALSRHDTLWASGLTIAVAIVVMYGRPTHGAGRPDTSDWWGAVVIGSVACLGAGIFAYRRAAAPKALILGAICGVIFGYVAVLSKIVADQFFSGGFAELVENWHLYALIVAAIIGTAVQQLAFAAGNLSQSLPAMTVCEPIVAFALGYLVLGEEFHVTTAIGHAVLVAALLVMAVATFKLARKRVA